MDNWCSPPSQSSQSGAQDLPNWKASCANQAVGICEGNIANVAQRWCPSQRMSGTALNSLKNQCDDEVDAMVGNDVRRPPTARPTPRPTRRPTPR